MKYYELEEIVKYLKRFTYISRARRVEDNTIELSFGRDDSIFFNMRRGGSFIYKNRSERPLQSYNAPFDALLHSLVSFSKIIDIDIPNGDRVIRFLLSPKSSYKEKSISLQFEFTGKHTNVILIDNREVVIEALRHIDSGSSFRVIRPATKLEPIPHFKRREEEVKRIDDIEEFLTRNYIEFEEKRFKALKKQKLLTISKKREKLERSLSRLADPKSLASEEKRYQNLANIVLANLYSIKPYDKRLKTYDFEGNSITIELPKGVVVNRISEYFFNKAKKARAKARNIHIEKENLTTKIEFYSNVYYALKSATRTQELELLVPKRGKSRRKREKIKECELFWIDDYKVLIGRNSKENQALLKMAKSNDIWMHIRDIPSSHLIIKTDKQNLPDSVIEKAGRLCVDFSIKQAGDYAVDYCKRKFVKIQDGSNVEYDKYKTIIVRKDGIEIRE
jgi:predicted ribosome quality control (RQC) complex YloA/Tae2 family protein